MNRNQKIAMAKKDLSIKRLGQIIDRHPAYISSVFSGAVRSKALRKMICYVLQEPESYLWPSEEKEAAT
jgi:hypothetical protein